MNSTSQTEPSFALSENFFKEAAIALGNSSYMDVKIILSDDPMRPEYRLHKVILAAQSTFFRKLFYHEPKEVYEIGAVAKGAFDSVLGYMYGGDLILTEHNYDDIMEVVLYLGCEKMEAMLTRTLRPNYCGFGDPIMISFDRTYLGSMNECGNISYVRW